jgi:LacI family transcriptional regulator, gluconate utilization system Gnt-I transcriptional repressor
VIATGKRPRTRQIDLGFEIVARGSTGPHVARPSDGSQRAERD